MAIAKGEQIAAWVASARRGDAVAFERLVRQFQDAVAGVALARLGPGPDVEDVAQEAFLAAFRQLDEFGDPANFGPWVCGIARNLARQRLRDERPGATLSPDIEARGEPGTSDMATGVMEAVSRLPERLCEPVTLFYINGYSSSEVAALLEIPSGTVRRRLHEARDHLRHYLERSMADEIKRNAPQPEFAGKVRRQFTVFEDEGDKPDTGKIVTISSDDPGFSKGKADEQWREIQALIGKGQFELSETLKEESGTTTYLYRFVLSDGARLCFGSDLPLTRNPFKESE